MELPLEYKTILESKLDNYSLSILKVRVNSIINRYKYDSGSSTPIIKDQLDAYIYAVYRFPATYKVCSDIFSNYSLSEVSTVIDVGAGSGAASLALSYYYPHARYYLLESNIYMKNVGLDLLSSFNNMSYIDYDINKSNLDIKGNMVLASYVYNELDKLGRINLINKMINMSNHYLLFIEPGTPIGYKNILEIKDYLSSYRYSILGPCPNIYNCPLKSIESRWCHYSSRVSRSKLVKDLKEGDVPYEDEKYIYLLIDISTSEIEPTSRIISNPKINKGYVELVLCTSNGLKNIKVTKKDKELYKIAKKKIVGDPL